jgi:hypothetical protein
MIPNAAVSLGDVYSFTEATSKEGGRVWAAAIAAATTHAQDTTTVLNGTLNLIPIPLTFDLNLCPLT